MTTPVAKSTLCLVCDAVIRFDTLTNESPGCPEFVRATAGVWVGMVSDGVTGVRMVCVCSEHCCRQIVEATA